MVSSTPILFSELAVISGLGTYWTGVFIQTIASKSYWELLICLLHFLNWITV